MSIWIVPQTTNPGPVYLIHKKNTCLKTSKKNIFIIVIKLFGPNIYLTSFQSIFKKKLGPNFMTIAKSSLKSYGNINK